MDSVKCGMVAEVISTLKEISVAAFKAFDHLVDLGLRVDGVEKQQDGTFILQIRTNKKHVLKCKMIPRGGRLFDMQFKKKNGKVIERKKVKDEDVDDTVLDAIREIFGPNETVDDSWIARDDSTLDSSVHLTVKKNISASGKVNVCLTNVYASSDPVKAYTDLGYLLSDESFVDSIPEGEECSYCLKEDGADFLDVQEEEPCEKDLCGIISSLISTAYNLLFHLQYVSWMSGDIKDNIVKMAADNMKWLVYDQISQLGELSVEMCGKVGSPSEIVTVAPEGMIEPTIDSLVPRIDEYICGLELLTYSLEADATNMIMYWIRNWKKELHYHLRDSLSTMASNVPLPIVLPM